MFGKNRGSQVPPSSNDDTYRHFDHLLDLANEAAARGESYEAAHLYLAAFDSSLGSDAGGFQPAIDGLFEAWDIACALKDRSLAEHVFEKIEPHLSSEQLAEYAEALQRLALDKLEEFGLSRDDLKSMADMVSNDFGGIVKDNFSPEALFAHFVSSDSSSASKAPSLGGFPLPHGAKAAPDPDDEKHADDPEANRYEDLVGFDRAIAHMHARGIGLSADESFQELLGVLSRRHGIDALPAYETMVFHSPSRDDAHQFMLATAQEIGFPAVRMYMEQTPMGFPVLCVMTTSDFRMNPSRGFTGPGLLLLEDIDQWGAPFSSEGIDEEMLPYVQFTRGARDAVMFVRSAVENPDVQVMATCGDALELDDFFADLLGSITYIDIGVPDEQERLAVWQDVFSLYPSLRPLNSDDLVRLSANLSRCDIYLAAREAVDQAYRSSIEQRSYIPVTRDNLYDKIAAYQPLDSSEYLELEQSAVDSFRNDLDDLDELLKGSE